ncbi:hypothetical protein JCM16303_004746 [Sporobolomyces ruberrimus]
MAAALKAQGNAYFAKQDWEGAVECYSRSLELEEDPIATSTLLSNRCACYIHLEQFPEAQADASRCINLRPDWSKGHARSGEAYSRSQAFGLAEIACECSSPISIMGLRRLLNYIVPLSKAYAALAYVAAVQGCEPVRPGTIPSGEVRPANLEKVQEAARYYDLAFDLLPDDYYVKPAFGFMALEQHLRAGGLTARELFERYEDVELMRIDIARFFTGLNELNSARSFVEQQVEAIRDYVGENPSSSWDQTIKPIPSINLHGVAEDDQGIDMVFWLNLPGQIGIADVWGSNKVLRVTTFA